jgi:D-3-phosphoglycerate dehydrogenase
VAGTAQEIELLVRQVDPIAILTCWAQVSKVAIQFPSRLAIVARLGVGLDNVAVDAATMRGAWVTNVPDYCVSEVSDHAIALLLTHYRGIARLDALAKKNGWQTNSTDLERIGDLTVAIIGLGRIGRQTARKLTAFGCRILALARGAEDVAPNVTFTDMAQIHAQADVIILHAPYNAKSSRLIDRAFLTGCRRKPLLINVSRGGLVDNDALLEALNAGQLRGAALDVIDGEPAPPLSLIQHPSVIVTPHIAFASRAAVDELRRRACEEVVRVLQGNRPLHPCNQPISGTPLDGGVASDIRIVEGRSGPEVIKRALPKLKVAADWFSDPARSSIEVAAIGAFVDLIGAKVVPEVLWSRPEENLFSMRLVDPRLRNWKKDLLNGRVDVRTAIRAGELLGQVHTRSANRTDLRTRFADTRYFEELRIEPFFLRVAAADRALGDAIEGIVAGMGQRKSALVHGDYSPKNILADGSDVVILDFEVTHWGDPRFDVALCLSHLILKTQRHSATSFAVRQAITSFIAGYRAHGPSVLDRDLVQITGCLLLARLEGASPVDYLADIDIPYVRSLAAMMITEPELSIDAYESQFRKFAQS